MAKEKYTVSWTMPDEKIIKLKEPNQTYDISEKVHAYLEKAKLYDGLDDKTVEVEINPDEGENGMIVHLKVLDGKVEPKKEEKKTEDKPAEVAKDIVIKELTVAGVSPKNAGVIFKEEEGVWYTLDSTLDAQKFKDECTKKVVEIHVAPQEKGNDVIKSYILKEEPVDEDKVEPEQKMNDRDAFYRIKELERQVRYLKEQQEKSFEAQSAVNSASQAVSGMTVIHGDKDKVLKALEDIAIKNYEVIQKLKSKE